MTMSFINENTLRVVFETPEEEEEKKDYKVKWGMIFEILDARAGYIDYRVNEKSIQIIKVLLTWLMAKE